MDIFCCCWTAKSKLEVGVVEKIVVRRLIIELLYCFFFLCFSKTKSIANKLTNIRGQKGEFLFWKSREETRQ